MRSCARVENSFSIRRLRTAIQERFIFSRSVRLRGEVRFLVEKAEILLSAARNNREQQRWWVRLMVLMPDHLHALVSFPAPEIMARCVGDWKRFTARKTGIVWQKNYFDHRIRDEANLQVKADYIRQNPVRAGLVGRPEDWPWKIENGG